MKEMKLPKMSTAKPPRSRNTGKENGPCTNLLAQRFDQNAPNLCWVCDFTYVRVGGRFCYICAILDLYARKVIACRVGRKIDRFLAIDTLRDAVRLRGGLQGCYVPHWQRLSVHLLSVISQFSGIFAIRFSPIKTQKKQPKLQFYEIWLPKCHRIFEVLFRILSSLPEKGCWFSSWKEEWVMVWSFMWPGYLPAKKQSEI